MDPLYQAWTELLGWMQGYAEARGVRYVVEAHFPDAIYRLARRLELPTTVMTASLAFPEDEERFLLASVTPPGTRERGVELRVMKAHLYLHLHPEDGELVYEGRPMTERRLYGLADAARRGLRG